MSDTEETSLDEQVLEEIFNDAANVVQANATGSAGVKPSDAQLLELYGLYKVATTGPCNEPQPGIFSVKARSKWSAWKDKSNFSKTEAMSHYIHQVMNLYNWSPPSAEDLANSSEQSPSRKSAPTGFAPAVSRPHVEEEEDTGDKDTPFGWVKDNDIGKLNQWISNGKADLNICDDDGLTLLHWAADRGRKEVCEILLKAGANPQLTDEDEQTPLDYAITCEHDDIVLLLRKHFEVTPAASEIPTAT